MKLRCRGDFVLARVLLAAQVLGTRSFRPQSSAFWVEDTLASEGVRSTLSPAPEDIGVPWQLLSGLRFLMRVLDSYGDDYRTSQFTIVLEVSVGFWGAEGTGSPGCSLYLHPVFLPG